MYLCEAKGSILEFCNQIKVPLENETKHISSRESLHLMTFTKKVSDYKNNLEVTNKITHVVFLKFVIACKIRRRYITL